MHKSINLAIIKIKDRHVDINISSANYCQYQGTGTLLSINKS